MAIDVKARAPKEVIIPLRIVRFSEKALTAGVKIHPVEGIDLKVYKPPKTVGTVSSAETRLASISRSKLSATAGEEARKQ